jgi:serine/threonine-protein kinase
MGVDMASGGGWSLAISPDGRSILKVEQGSSHIRTASDPEWRQLPNTEGGINPSFSPDGQSVAFNIQGGGGISKVSIIGGLALPVTTSGNQPHWGFDETIVYNDGGALYRVGSSEGDPQVLLNSDSVSVSRPHLLPNGRAVVLGTGGGAQASRILIFEIETGEMRELVPAGNQPRYVSTGHLIYGHGDGALMGVPFDLETLQTTGTPVTLIPELTVHGSGASMYAVSATGTLVYLTGSADDLATPVWVERNGTASPIDPNWPSHTYDVDESSVALSPTGDRLAFTAEGETESTADVYVKALDDGPLSQITVDGTRNRRAAWAPDERSLIFVSNRDGQQDIWSKRADGSGTAERILTTGDQIEEVRYSRDGTWVVFRTGGGQIDDDLYAYRPGVDTLPRPLLTSDANEQSPALSPNGRWLAYASDVSGRNEVYVRPFPDTDSGRSQVSTDGGLEPVWANSGRELFYRNGADELVAAQVQADSVFSLDGQEILFSMAGFAPPSGRHQTYDVDTDDRRFVMFRIDSGEGVSATYLVTNWFTELRERMGN